MSQSSPAGIIITVCNVVVVYQTAWWQRGGEAASCIFYFVYRDNDTWQDVTVATVRHRQQLKILKGNFQEEILTEIFQAENIYLSPRQPVCFSCVRNRGPLCPDLILIIEQSEQKGEKYLLILNYQESDIFTSRLTWNFSQII